MCRNLRWFCREIRFILGCTFNTITLNDRLLKYFRKTKVSSNFSISMIMIYMKDIISERIKMILTDFNKYVLIVAVLFSGTITLAEQGDLLWQIGLDNDNSSEFHISGEKERFTNYYPENITFKIGQDNVEVSFPAYLPGPEDVWARHMANEKIGYVHPLTLFFNVDVNQADMQCELVLDVVARNNGSAMLMLIDINGYRNRYWMDSDTKSVRFRSNYLKQGSKIILTPLSSTYIEWDCLRLVSRQKETADIGWEDYPEMPVQLVDPTYHTGFYNRVFESKPGAGAPYAMIHSSPDTGGGSYWYGSDSLAGIRCLYDYCLGAFRLSARPGQVDPVHYGGHVDKKTEILDPGYWNVDLNLQNTSWEGTGTTYCSLFRFTSEVEQSEFNIYFDVGEKIAEIEKVHDAFVKIERTFSVWLNYH